MISVENFVRRSLELNLFFMRIMREHSFFLEAGFTPKNSDLAQIADEFKTVFTQLLAENIALSRGIVSSSVLSSGEIVTGYTLEAEKATEFYTNIFIDTSVTNQESELPVDGRQVYDAALEQRVADLNERTIGALSKLIGFKDKLLQDVLSCEIFTFNYPLLIDHLLREARLYLSMLEKLQRRTEVDLVREAIRQEAFWDRIMAEHAKFIRGLLDPTEETLINIANNFGGVFDKLTREAVDLEDDIASIKKLTRITLGKTIAISDFKSEGTAGILNCQIRSIIVPLLADHVLREANHFIRLLNQFNRKL